MDVNEQPKTALQWQKEAPPPKVQVIEHRNCGNGIYYGSKHDFQLFKDAQTEIAKHVRILADAVN